MARPRQPLLICLLLSELLCLARMCHAFLGPATTHIPKLALSKSSYYSKLARNHFFIHGSAAEEEEKKEEGDEYLYSVASSGLKALVIECRDDSGNDLDPSLLSDFLMEIGACSVSIEDSNRGTAAETPVYREPPTGGVVFDGADTLAGTPTGALQATAAAAAAPRPLWAASRVVAHLPAAWNSEEVVMLVGATFELAVLPAFRVEDIQDRDWVSAVQENWQPMILGSVRVKFPWHSDLPAEEGVTDILLQGSFQSVEEVVKPIADQSRRERAAARMAATRKTYSKGAAGGAAFGTGDHPTTRMCARWVQEQAQRARPGTTLLDYGAGSGILGMIAMKFGIQRVVGVEIDRDAIRTAIENAKLNKLEMEFYLPEEIEANSNGLSVRLNKLKEKYNHDVSVENIQSDEKFDITVANILAGPLKKLAPIIAKFTKEGGVLGLSGIIDHQADIMLEVYSTYFDDMKVVEEEGGWVCVSGVRNSVNAQ
uniref:ETFB lysine methyltransferase n=1 Tax=Heterosigma akashiwo TaxID=2829 RepID=A0A6V1NRU4_HETAK